MKPIHLRLAWASMALALGLLALASFSAYLHPDLILATFAVTC
jgi:hypothetical protein